MNNRFCIICKERGVFLGTYDNYGFFSKLYDFGLYKAPTFKDSIEAKLYADKFLKQDEEDFEFIIGELKTQEKYVSCVNLIKEGYGEHTGQMMDNLPEYSNAIH